MRDAISLGLLLTALGGAGQAQQFYSDDNQPPRSGPARDFLQACWAGIRTEMGDAPVQAEMVMIPEFKPLTDARKSRYGMAGPVDGMVYADMTIIVWTADPTGVGMPMALRCEVPMDPKAPDYSRVFVTEDQSMNPNLPPRHRRPRD